jgi:hypothetical protein
MTEVDKPHGLSVEELDEVIAFAKKLGFATYVRDSYRRAVFTASRIAKVEIIYDATHNEIKPVVTIGWTSPDGGQVNMSKFHGFNKLLREADKICFELVSRIDVE